MEPARAEEILKQARDAVASAELPPELLVPGFQWAVEAIAGRLERPAVDADIDDDPGVDGDEGGVIATTAQSLGVTAAELSDVMYVDDAGVPHINISANVLPNSTAPAARLVALLTHSSAANRYRSANRFGSELDALPGLTIA